ncbi:DegT/DnrJ/EryC1/StrS family aminotransferase [uncultured Paraglaciecola sp.]|uniref:DegT/DnrJ/EryC1/StrS family aminotransferase n=1 Tax=uncultured Paraglaciecola sp. TaxID=1765024 RepID=UPI00261C4EF8|nr:DegT/DnrJ/EryC1/StrS family aminotransferase [uncultured Paraglaciecola sp.]
MEVIFPPVMADAAEFPPVTIKAPPKFRLKDLRLFPEQLELNNIQLTRNGRGAMGVVGTALKHSDKKNVILIPAYHCPALVEPFIHLGYEIRFYPILPSLGVDISEFRKLLKKDVTHCIVIRYFGFTQNIDDVINLAKSERLLVIEDCAHALFSFMEYENLGSTSEVDAKICSINKLLPSIDGGALYFKNNTNIPLLKLSSWVQELKGCLFLLGITNLINRFRFKTVKQANYLKDDSEFSHADTSGLKYFSPSDMASAGYRHTRFILNHSNFKKVAKKRRYNFDYLLKELNKSKIGKPLYQNSENNIPYVFPFLLNDERHFVELRKMGIQVLRWEEVALSDCIISQDYRNRLVQLPCHQSLRQEELESIVKIINSMENN